MSTCKECNDTGVVETGNNDIPCVFCSAGDTAIFTCVNGAAITGEEIKRRDSLPQLPIELGDRIEYDHLFRWNTSKRCWHDTSRKTVVVIPPPIESPFNAWIIITAHDEKIEIRGDEAEKRAFCVATGYTKQKS